MIDGLFSSLCRLRRFICTSVMARKKNRIFVKTSNSVGEKAICSIISETSRLEKQEVRDVS